MPNALSSMPGPSGTANIVLDIIAGVSIVATASLYLLNTDVVSRRIFNHETLFNRRVQSARFQLKKCLLSSLDKYNDSTKLVNDDHMEKFIESLTVPGSMTPQIIGIHQDKLSLEYYLILNCVGHEEYGDMGILRLPIVEFCTRLAKKFERIVSSVALCFIADASANLGPALLKNVLQASTDVAILTPGWMGTLALLIESNVIPTDKVDKILFALCRMEARKQKDNVKVSRTVVFNFPGQAFVPALLPVAQRVFPCERHLFVYDGCCSSVARSLEKALSKSYNSENQEDSYILFTNESTRVTIGSSLDKTLRHYKSKLAKLPEDIANSVSSWVGSVDTFLRMKDYEDDNEYLPFVLRLGFLLGRTEGIGSTDSDLSDICLVNVMQFITGARSRALGDETLKCATNAIKLAQLDDMCISRDTSLGKRHKEMIEACVFCHKSILIGDKTLLDTVQPKKEWSLKAAKKLQSCACCAIPDDDDNPGPDERINVSKSEPQRYVDGKVTFAFDPTKFDLS